MEDKEIKADRTESGAAGAGVAAGRSAYESKIGVEAVLRSGGKNPQLKGVIHEELYRDAVTLKPENLLNGTHAELTKSVTAVRDDVITKCGGSVVGRAQLKDTANSIGKTVQQVQAGKYTGTNLMGTVETTKAYNAAVDRMAASGKTVTQKMTSTGISSKDTARIAAQTIGGEVTAASVAQMAASSGGAGAVISGGITAVTDGVKLIRGEIDGGEFVGNVAKEAVSGGVSAAAGSVAATAVATGAATVLAATAAPLWLPGALAIGAAVAVGSGVRKLFRDIFFDW